MKVFRLFKVGLLVGLLLAGLSSVRAGESRTKEEVLAIGESALEDGLFDIAQKEFERYIRMADAPADKAAGVLLQVRALFEQGRFNEALDLLNERLAWTIGSPAAPGFAYWKARVLFEQGQAAEALDLLKDFKRAFGDNPYRLRADRLRIKCHLQLQRYNEALDVFKTLSKNYNQVPEFPDILLEWAGTLISMGKSDDSVTILQRILDDYPLSDSASRARLWLGEIYTVRQDTDRAEQMFKTLAEDELAQADRRASAWLALARIYEAKTNLAAAVDALANVSGMARDTSVINRGNLSRGKLLVRSGRVDEGIRVLQDFVRANLSDPMAATVQLELAESLFERSMFDKAAEEFQHYLEAFSSAEGQARALMGKGWSLWGLGRYAESASAFDKAYSLLAEPREKMQALVKAADALFANKQYTLANEKYRQAVSEFPGGALALQARFQAAECLARLGEADKAEQEFREIVLVDLKNPLAEQAGLRVAVLKEEQGKWEQAVDIYTQVIRLFRRGALRPQAYHGRGMIRYRLGQFKEALGDFEEVVTRFPASSVAEQDFYMRGWCLYLLGENQKALEVCQQFIEKYPASPWAQDVLFWLGEYQYNHGNYAEAEKQFTELADRFPQGSLADSALFWAARSASARKEYLRAIDLLNRLSRDYPESTKLAEARFAQGDALSELGQFGGAILAFEEIINKFPSSYLVNLAWGRKGDCQFTLGNEDPERYQEALVSYRVVLDSATAGKDLKWQAEFKIGRCQEKMGQMEDALTHYMNVGYDYLLSRQKGYQGGDLWFTRAAFNAAQIKESQQKWREAVNIYRRVADSGVAAAAEAQERIRKIRLEHWVLF